MEVGIPFLLAGLGLGYDVEAYAYGVFGACLDFDLVFVDAACLDFVFVAFLVLYAYPDAFGFLVVGQYDARVGEELEDLAEAFLCLFGVFLG